MKKALAILLPIVIIVTLAGFFGCTTTTPAEPTPEPTATSTATATATATQTATIAPTIGYDFASDLQSWYIPSFDWTLDQAFTTAVHDGASGHSAVGSASMTGNFDATAGSCCNPVENGNVHEKGDFEVTITDKDLNGKTVSCWIYVPTDMADTDSYTAQFYLKNDGSDPSPWAYSSGAWTDLFDTGWVQVTADISTFTGTANLSSVDVVGIQVYRNYNAGTPAYDLSGSTIKFDDILIY